MLLRTPRQVHGAAVTILCQLWLFARWQGWRSRQLFRLCVTPRLTKPMVQWLQYNKGHTPYIYQGSYQWLGETTNWQLSEDDTCEGLLDWMETQDIRWWTKCLTAEPNLTNDQDLDPEKSPSEDPSVVQCPATLIFSFPCAERGESCEEWATEVNITRQEIRSEGSGAGACRALQHGLQRWPRSWLQYCRCTLRKQMQMETFWQQKVGNLQDSSIYLSLKAEAPETMQRVWGTSHDPQ